MGALPVFALTDKVAIVTGGGTGLGRAIAMEFARSGAHVVVASRTMSRLEEAAAEIRKLGRRSCPVAADVTKPNDVENLVDRTVKEFGKIDILVNDATAQTGGMLHRATVENMTQEQWDALFAVDMRGTFLCCQAVGKVMIAQNKGKIINISSMFGVLGSVVGHSAYASAKAGVIIFSKSLAVEWGQYNINVNCIAPGPIMTKAAVESLTKMGVYDRVTKLCALKRGGRPEEIAYGAVFLASEASDFVNGVTLPIDGGPGPLW